MNRSVLKRTKIWTIVLGLGCALISWFVVSPLFAVGLAVTAFWAVIGFAAVEGLIKAALVPPGTPRNLSAILTWGTVKVAVYGLAFWVLFTRPFPALSHAIGLTLLLVVLVGVGISTRHPDGKQPAKRGEDG